MTHKITSKYTLSPSNPMVSVVGFTGLFALAALVLLLVVIGGGMGEFVLIAGLSAYITLWFLLLHYFWREYPVITIDRDGIWLKTWFSRAGFPWEGLKSIQMFVNGGKNLIVSAVQHDPAVTLRLTDGRKYSVLIGGCYRNGAALGQVLDQARQLLADNKPVGPSLRFEAVYLPEVTEAPDFTESVVFAGNHFLSARGILFYGFNVFLLYTYLPRSVSLENLGGAMMLHLFSWFFGYAFFYFRITATHLVVRHHQFFWYKKAFPWRNIRAVESYQQMRRATTLRIILKDCRIYNFPAGSLSGEDWRRLENAINEKGFSMD